MKVFIKLLLMLAMLTYLVFAFVKFNKKKHDPVCTNVSIAVADSDKANFVTVDDIRQILKDTKLNPVGKSMSNIHLGKIKKAVDSHQFVLNSLCYTTPKGDLVITVNQKLPVMRVMPNVGEGYYIDVNGNKILHIHYPADVVVVTGNVDYRKYKPVLSTLGRIIHQDEFWNDMIEQINFTSSGKIELTPRVGNHVVALGRPQDLGTKLAHLKLFYEKVLNTVGWNKYSRISLEYSNQAVCTKYEENVNNDENKE